MKRSWAPMLLAAGLLAACAGTTRMDRAPAAWQGQPFEDLLSAWGPPDTIFRGSDGWRSVSYLRPAPPQDGLPPYCTVSFTVDRQGTIVESSLDDPYPCRQVYRF